MPFKRGIFWYSLLLCTAFGGSIGQAAEARWDAVGVRAGADLTDGHGSCSNDFELYQLFANYLLPFQWRRSSALELRTVLDASAGALRRRSDTGFIASFGPSLALAMFSDRLEIDGGVAVAYLSLHNYPGRDLGGPIEFVSHVGIGVYPLGKIGIGYRFEHISNANLYRCNPGVNLHAVELKYRF